MIRTDWTFVVLLIAAIFMAKWQMEHWKHH